MTNIRVKESRMDRQLKCSALRSVFVNAHANASADMGVDVNSITNACKYSFNNIRGFEVLILMSALE